MRERLIAMIRGAGRAYADYVTEKYSKGSRYSKDSHEIGSYEEAIADYLLANGVIVSPCKVRH